MTRMKALKMSAAGLACALVLLPASAPSAQAQGLARAQLTGPDGQDKGIVWFRQEPEGVRIAAGILGIDHGVHAIHIHETGKCQPDFKAAGGHYAPDDRSHGLVDEEGPHAGDLSNFLMPVNGPARFQRYSERISLDGEHSLFDDDGSAVIVHAGRDDHRTDPAGGAGKRVACGIIEKVDRQALQRQQQSGND